MHLGIAQLVPDVVEPFVRRYLTSALEHALGDVDAHNAARRRGTRRLASSQPGSAPDVDDIVTGPDPVGGAKVLVVSAQLGVVEVQPVRRGHGASGVGLVRPRAVSAPQSRLSTLDSICASSFVVVLQLRSVMFLYSGSEATLLSRLLVAFAASREK